MIDPKQESRNEVPKSVYIEAPVAKARFNFNPLPPVETEAEAENEGDDLSR